MKKSIVDQIIKALEKVGVEVKGESLTDVREELASVSLEGSGLTEVGDDQTVIKQSQYEDMRKNLRELRQTKRELEEKVGDLEQKVQGGDSQLQRDLDQAKAKLNELEPLVERFTGEAKSRWERYAKQLPEQSDEMSDEDKALRGLFKFAAKEGEELGRDELLHNLTKYQELRSLGVIGSNGDSGKGSDSPPKDSPKPPPKKDEPKDADAAWLALYGKQEAGDNPR